MSMGKRLILSGLLLLSLLAGLLCTTGGLRLMVWGAEKAVPELKIENLQGSVWSGFTLQRVRYHAPDGQLDIDLQQVALTLDLACLLRPELCIHSLELDDVKLVLTQPESQEEKKEVKADPVPLPEISLPIPVDLTRFVLRDFRFLSQPGQAPLVINQLHTSVHASGHDITLRQFVLDMPLLDAELSGGVSLESDYPLTLKALTKLKQTALAGQEVSLTATGSVDKLQFMSRLSGPVSASAQGELQPLHTDLPFALRVSEGRLQWPLEGEAEYQVQLSELQVEGTSERYRLTALADLSGKPVPDARISLSGQGDQQQLNLADMLVNTLGGEIRGQVHADWSGPVSWQGQLTLQHIQPGRQWAQAEGALSGSLATSGKLLDSGGWQVDMPALDIQGIIREYPLTVKGRLTAEDKSGQGDIHLITDGLSLRHGRNGISLTGSMNEELDIRARVDIPDLQHSLSDASGRITGTLALQGARDKPELVSSLRATQIRYGEFLVGTASFNADIAAQPMIQGQLDLQAEGARYNDQAIDSLSLALSGQQDNHRLNLDVLSEIADIHMQVSGGIETTDAGFSPDNVTWQGSLDSAQVASRQGKWDLGQPAKLAYSGTAQQVSVQAHCWKQAGSRLCLTEDMQAGASGNAHVALQSFDFKQIAILLPEDIQLEGGADLTGRLSWLPGQLPAAQVALILPQGRVLMKGKKAISQGWEQAQLNASMNAGGLESDWQIQLTDNGDVSGALAVTDLLSESKEVSGQVKINNIDLAILDAWLGDYSHLGAIVNSDLSLSGPLLHPMVHGRLLIDDILAQGEFTPVEINAGQVTLEFSGYQAELAAELQSADGTLSVSGDGQWQDLDAWASRVSIHSDELQISLPPTAEIKARPDLQIEASPGLAKISGDIYLPWARLEVEELPESAVSVSSDEVVLDKNLNPVKEKKPMTLTVETDVRVHIGDDFRLSAFGLEGYLNGLLNISQKDQAPFVVGDVEIRDGTYRSFGQDLIINEGKILMNGPVDRPYVSIKAIRNPENIQDEVTVGIAVTGLASQPEIEVFSDPDMPQANALSYLLRGRDLDTESGDNSMTMTLIGLSLAQSGKIVGEIGEAFGVSDLQLDTAGSGDDSQVTVSGYILPGLQVKYGVGIFNSLGEVTIRYRLMKDLYLEAVSGLTSTVDLLYQFEFD
ncbi:hypothetical protein DI392_09225 [Vibrio albus]|uniref:Translocation and assembly module TamB C-terminal domain-containing protein n=1 Tax=Vibrio albus TaxID=2200953 RepID=A0A2U3BA39_9VIBR|nr:translocation/assembly module TamB domain-containing protein [Vibrio albus]PWI33633.1 hypothetical protein DI392_09225 [Vibrio albus]